MVALRGATPHPIQTEAVAAQVAARFVYPQKEIFPLPERFKPMVETVPMEAHSSPKTAEVRVAEARAARSGFNPAARFPETGRSEYRQERVA